MRPKNITVGTTILICLLAAARVLAQEATGSFFVYLPIINKAEVNILTVMPVGPGGSDVISRQIVRASDDKLYLFGNRNGSNIIYSYRTPSAGLPTSSANFTAGSQLTIAGNEGKPMAVDAIYDGGNYIHLLVNTTNGRVKLYPYNLSTNAFIGSGTQIATNGHTMNPNDLYVGTMGVSGLMDTNGNLHLTYWRSDNRIEHRAYTYNSGTNSYTLSSAGQLVDTAGSANHPSLAISPVNNSVVVAWVEETGNPTQRKIRARVRTSAGTWGAVETVANANVWTSTQFGINVDQGPSMVIDNSGVVHLTYMQNYDGTGDYGRVHYVTRATNGTWTDTALNFYSHAPAIGMAGSVISIIGHGHPQNPSGPCKSLDDMCFLQKTGNSWGSLQLLYNNPSGTSLDASPSVKWSVVGYHRPQTTELVFFSVTATSGLDYYNPTLLYARLP